VKAREISLLFLLALCLSWGGFNMGRSLLGPKFGLDFTQYYVASRMVLQGEANNIYRTGGHYRTKAAEYGAVTDGGTTMTNAYPPFVAFCFIPFALLPFRPALLAFSITGILALAAGVWLFFAEKDGITRRHLTLAGLLITFSFFPVYDSIYMGQANALLFLCAALVLYFARRDRPWWVGFFIALAALIKIYPAVLVLLFAARRQFKPVLAATVSTIGLVSVSLPVCKPSLYITWVSQVLPREASGGAYYRNQGLPGLFSRLLTENPYAHALVNRPGLAGELGVLAGALVLIAALWVAGRRHGNGCHNDIEFGLCFAATLLALPKSWEHYALLLLFAYLAVFRMVFHGKSIPRVPLLLTFLSFCVWTFLLPTGTDYAQLPHSVLMQPLFSAKCLATLMLFVACVWILLDQGRSGVKTGQQAVLLKARTESVG
jgi:hypothetical protein